MPIAIQIPVPIVSTPPPISFLLLSIQSVRFCYALKCTPCTSCELHYFFVTILFFHIYLTPFRFWVTMDIFAFHPTKHKYIYFHDAHTHFHISFTVAFFPYF